MEGMGSGFEDGTLARADFHPLDRRQWVEGRSGAYQSATATGLILFGFVAMTNNDSGRCDQAAQAQHQLRQPIVRQHPNLRMRRLDSGCGGNNRCYPFSFWRHVEQDSALGGVHEYLTALAKPKAHSVPRCIRLFNAPLQIRVVMINPSLDVIRCCQIDPRPLGKFFWIAGIGAGRHRVWLFNYRHAASLHRCEEPLRAASAFGQKANHRFHGLGG